jgi:hypothetical protein
MRTGPLQIEGLAGPVVITSNSFTGRQSITVGGQPVPGSRLHGYKLPTADGRTVDARLRTSLYEPYPSLKIGDVTIRTGPPVPIVLRMLALLPFGLIIGGLIGALAGAAGILANMAIARSSRTTAAKAVLMVMVLAAGVVVWLSLASAFQVAVGGA